MNNSYGYGVYKRHQVNIGNPYKMKLSDPKPSVVEDIFEEAAAAKEDPEKDLRISQDIIYKAKEEAASIKREAELEVEKLYNEAIEKVNKEVSEIKQIAKEEGYKYGEELAQQHYSDLIAEAVEFKERCKQEYEETIAALEQDIVELVINIAAKVVGDEIRGNQESILGVVRETIKSCSNREKVILKVSPDDYEVVVRNEEKLLSSVIGLNELEIKKDGALEKGSCIIDTGFGSVDGSVDVRMENIRKAFFKLLGDELYNE
ncbi:MAG: FliH/SctL family protein [Acetivibrionales bacterium]|jgi:flagellar assembly protein FliH